MGLKVDVAATASMHIASAILLHVIDTADAGDFFVLDQEPEVAAFERDK